MPRCLQSRLPRGGTRLRGSSLLCDNAAAVFALIGKIPYLGELFFGIPYLIWFFGSVFVVYTSIVLIVASFFTPAIVGAMEEDTR